MPVTRWRLCCGAAGITTLAIVWTSPLTAIAADRFSAYAALHVAVVCIAAPLLAIAVCGSRFDPVLQRPRGFSPLAAALIELLVIWAWHAPVALEARDGPAMLGLQQMTFLGAGLLLWVSVLGGDGKTRYERAGVGIIALLLTSMHMTLLGVVTMIADRQLYSTASSIAMLDDQRLGGLLVLGGAGIIYMIAGLVLLTWLLRPAARVSRARYPA